MALIKCPECNNEVSSSALSCPRCGYPIKQHLQKIIADAIDQGNEYCKLGPSYAIEAIDEFKKAADLGDRHGMYCVGYVYAFIKDSDDWYPNQDNWPIAFEWFKKAAELGHLDAMWTVGGWLSCGKGTAKDPYEGVKWWKKAAELGHVNCMYCMGSAYEEGEGVPKDLEEAKKWYRLAAQHGDENAKSKLQDLE